MDQLTILLEMIKSMEDSKCEVGAINDKLSFHDARMMLCAVKETIRVEFLKIKMNEYF